MNGDVPVARGLGASACLRLGVLHGLNRLAGNPLDRLSIFQLAARLEGHPDNAAPASFGGFTVVRGETVQRFEVSPRLYFVLLIPDLEIETPKARKVLPAKIDRVAAVKSSANACAITAAFASRDYENLRGAFADHLPSTLSPKVDSIPAARHCRGRESRRARRFPERQRIDHRRRHARFAKENSCRHAPRSRIDIRANTRYHSRQRGRAHASNRKSQI